MLRRVLLSVVLLGVALAGIEIFNYDPVANPAAVVVSGNARFTVLTPQLIRLEYSSNGTFEDRATLAFLNRNVTVPSFTQSTTDGILTITTSEVKLSYAVGQTFSASTLQVSALSAGAFESWSFGQANPGNLLGTIKSLDELDVISLNCTENANVMVHDEVLHCEWGLISQDGWSLVDDTTNYALDENYWWAGENTDEIDNYLFAHGWNYRQALADFVLVAGNIAMTPRYATGIWWSRWFNLDNYDVLQTVDDYRSRSIPLDVFILDMDWHTKNDWTGYSWDLRLFPDPADTMGTLHNLGLHMGANLHDADGVGSWETTYAEFATSVGMNPASGNAVPFNLINSTYAYGLEDIVLKAVENQGMDFWWIDWQQGGQQGGCTGLKQNPTIWTDHLRSTDHQRRGENIRGLVLARWGGLGNHRYQVGFSGDVNNLDWQDLAFQPYFSMTATNVGYGFWSHDTEGPWNNPEMYVRWVQWSAFSGVFRTHDRGMSAGGCADQDPSQCSVVQVWEVGTPYFEANRFAMQRRVSLVPYIYTAWRQAFDTGLSLIRPMYYDYPSLSNAYNANPDGAFPQYMFGDDILVSPIVSPCNLTTNMTTQAVWIPPGVWYEDISGAMLTGAADGSTILTKTYDISEVPVFYKGGSIIAQIPVIEGQTIGLAQQQYNTLSFTIYPGGSNGSTQVYEDDGYTVDYLQGQYVFTTAAYTQTGNTLTFTVSSQGSYASFPTSRTVILRLPNTFPPSSIQANGQSIPYARFGGPNAWTFSGPQMSTIIEVAAVSTSSPLTITVTLSEGNTASLVGIKGGLYRATLAKQNLDIDRSTPGSDSVYGGALDIAASTAEAISFAAGNLTEFTELVNGYPAAYAAAIAEIADGGGMPELVQLWDPAREDQCLCGVSACLSANNYYENEWIEGYQPLPNAAGAIPFYDYWNGFGAGNGSDNWGTTNATTPSGYSPAQFANGFVLSSQEAGTVPLQLWYSSSRGDHMTVASQPGIQYAQSNGYTLITAVLGYVYTSPPSEAIPPQRQAYSLALLEGGMN